MIRRKRILAASGGFLSETYRASGITGCARKLIAAFRMQAPLWTRGRRTNASVGAYFDLITDDARMFYGDSFHFGYFQQGDESFSEALNNHTDLVAEMAGVATARRILDVGCGICEPAARIAARHPCSITGVNISAEQVRQGRSLVASRSLADRISVLEANALKLPFGDATFDAALALEVAGDICVTDGQKRALVKEMHRVLAPGGTVGFSDLVFTSRPTREEERAMRAILYHDGQELITDWPAIFEACGFSVTRRMDIIRETMPTWRHSLAVYEARAEEVERRYGRRIARRTMEQLKLIPAILDRHGSFIVLAARKSAGHRRDT